MAMDTKQTMRDFIYSALFAALTISLGAVYIPLPFSPVPISGVSLGIMLAGSVLTRRQAVNSVLAVLLLGAAGFPVFSGFTGGVGVLFGPRGGYYFGFLAGAWVIASLRGESSGWGRLFAANILGGMLVVYLIAVPYLALVTGMGFYQALTVGALPFLLGDFLKACIASVLAVALRKHVVAFQTIK